ncbi:MAG: signal peptidase I [Clostridia bacterium]|nr:signal peptidase I [Clostridia bacterium]
MTRDKKILYASSVVLVLALLGALFLPGNNGRAITALILAVFAIAIFFLVKKRPILSINKNEVLLIMLAMGAVCLVVYYLTGVHFGFYKSSTPLSMGNFFRFILPISAIIIAIEVIRYVLLAQNAKLMGVLAFAAGALSDVLVFSSILDITNFNRFMDAMGLYLLPAFTANLLYNYVSGNFGFMPNIVYRLIITLYTYILPIYPQTPDALYSFAKLIVPLFIYLFINALYSKTKNYESHKSQAKTFVAMGLSAIIMISIVLLISGEFQYRALIIATESMTGEINKGDAIVYEEYDDQYIKEQDVVVFLQDDNRIVHRVVHMERIDGQNRYYTKGDANDAMDAGYITDADIEGVVLFKVPYVGYASIWLRDAFKK